MTYFVPVIVESHLKVYILQTESLWNILFIYLLNCYRLLQLWEDEYLRWDPHEYGGIKVITLPSENVWMPDITLYNK